MIECSDWLKIRSGCGILIYSAGQGLKHVCLSGFPFWVDCLQLSHCVHTPKFPLPLERQAKLVADDIPKKIFFLENKP